MNTPFKTLILPSFKDSSELLMKLEKANINLSSWAKDLVSKLPPRTKAEEVQLVRTTVRELGFTDWTRYDAILARAKERGLELCPQDTAIELRLNYLDQLVDDWFRVASEPITDSGGGPGVFRLYRPAAGLWLSGDRAHPETGWNADGSFVFRLRKDVSSDTLDDVGCCECSKRTDCTTPHPPEEWKKEFDEKFFQDRTGERISGWLAMKTGKLIEGDSREFCKIATPDDVLAFIENLLKSHEQALTERFREMVEDLRKRNYEALPADEAERIDEQAYEGALRDVLSLLTPPKVADEKIKT